MPLEDLLTVKEVMDILRVSRQTLHAMRKRGEVEAVKIGKSVRFRKGDIERLIHVKRQPE
jgi:excisionase family DNA binding protein